jgi:hypothetical protein
VSMNYWQYTGNRQISLIIYTNFNAVYVCGHVDVLYSVHSILHSLRHLVHPITVIVNGLKLNYISFSAINPTWADGGNIHKYALLYLIAVKLAYRASHTSRTPQKTKCLSTHLLKHDLTSKSLSF